MFSSHDIQQIKEHGLDLDVVNHQLELFAKGFPYTDIIKPASDDDGILVLSDADCQKYIDIYEEYSKTHKIMKFVPASGAATRMFKDLFDFFNSHIPNKTSMTTVANITKFAFWDDLKQYVPNNASDFNLVECLISDAGLNYGNLPKGLIAFHKYADGAKTPVEEHLSEGALYAKSGNEVYVHFTISPEHRHAFESLLNRVIPQYEKKYGLKYNVSLSEQKSSTDTIAVNLDNTPFRNPDDTLLFRPGGHGALIENLNEIDADMIFIKNIDNITVASRQNDTIKYKKVLAGILADKQKQIFDLIQRIDSGFSDLNIIHRFLNTKIGVKIDKLLSVAEYRAILNRPLRVCGMVKNTGAPGGGPFWVRDYQKFSSLQIVESSQIAPESKHIMDESTYFNPVDIVCCIKDFQDKKFDLKSYIDEDTGFISEKSKNGVSLKAMERPGLWNGSMARWNTLFVSVPGTTFSPVKTITDLLSPEHQ